MPKTRPSGTKLVESAFTSPRTNAIQTNTLTGNMGYTLIWAHARFDPNLLHNENTG